MTDNTIPPSYAYQSWQTDALKYYCHPMYEQDLRQWRAMRPPALGPESPEEREAFDALQAERDAEARKAK